MCIKYPYQSVLPFLPVFTKTKGIKVFALDELEEQVHTKKTMASVAGVLSEADYQSLKDHRQSEGGMGADFLIDANIIIRQFGD